MSHIHAKFGLIGFDCLLNINKQIVLHFVLEFYSQLTFDYNSKGNFVVNFVIQNKSFTLTLEKFDQILNIPFKVMHPLAPHYERKTRSDHGKKRPRDSNASSSFTTLKHPSLSRPLDDIVDENDEESFHSNSSSPSQNISSSSNVISRVRQNPPYESLQLNTYLFETINLQAQQ
uniref:Uncharacterized protein n=1 Tax=Tanacetum cinerariifolium TaxID=118510 RepID=A0A699HX86_TANCI|nr:hypothetical protein [Tanacetum cinerariifolium]